MKYKVEIFETLCKAVSVEASTMEEAEEAVHKMYYDGKIILSADDYISADFYTTQQD